MIKFCLFYLLPSIFYIDPNADIIADKRKEKKVRVAKNEMQQQRNTEEGMARAKGIDPRSIRKEELRRRLQLAKKSNASMGKFDKLQDGVKLHAGKRKVCYSFTSGVTVNYY